jgi:hypothetical protein
MPISLNAATYGESPSSLSFHGTMSTRRIIEPTKNVATRRMTDCVARAMARSGSLDSAAAMVAISAPTIENTTTTMLENTASTPLGKKPPSLVIRLTSKSLCGQRPITNSVPRIRKAMMAATLIPANQYSNSPYERTDARLVQVINTMSTSETSHSGRSTQNRTISAPATASKPTTITQKYQ